MQTLQNGGRGPLGLLAEQENKGYMAQDLRMAHFEICYSFD